MAALAGTLTSKGLEELEKHPLVLSVDLDKEVHALGSGDFEFSLLPQLAESVPVVNADDAHSKGITGSGVVVAVLDTGIDTDHPDLSDDIVGQHCVVPNGCPGGSGSAEDDNGHGTLVSGVITSKGTIAPKGVAPDAEIVAVKVMDRTAHAFVSWIIAGIDWVVYDYNPGHPNHRVSIINMSIGGALYGGVCDYQEGSLANAVNVAKANGIISFAGSGNEGSSTSMASPACLSNVVSVMATYDQARTSGEGCCGCSDLPTVVDEVACWANSNQYTDLAAPGAWIDTTQRGGGKATNTMGTSVASPHAAAVAALVKQANPSFTPDQIKDILKKTGVPVTDPKNGLTFPRVDAFSAIFIEVGEVSVNSNWMTVSLTRKFTNPVVVAKPMGYASSALAVVRIRNVTSTSFQIRIQPWDSVGGTHDYERVGYIVMEKGHYQLKGKGGATFEVEAGTTSTNCTHTCWKTVSFAPAFSATPVIISSVTTENEGQAVVTRNKGVTSSKFYVQMQEQEKNPQSHIAETISYIAWTPTPSASDSKGFYIDGKAFKVGTTGTYVKDPWYTITFNPDPDSPFTRTPALIADMQTKNGTDPCNLRWRNKRATGVEVKVAEEQSWDSETTHESAENVGFLAFACASCSTSFSPSFAFSEPESKMESQGEELVVESTKSFPNPLKRTGVVTFEIQGEGISEIKVEVYDLAGRRVWDSGFRPGQSLRWHVLSERGELVANGVYLYIVRARGFNEEIVSSKVRKLVVLR